MILIQRYIFKELVYNFIFTFVIIAMIMLLAMSVKVVFKFPMFGFLLMVKLIPIMLTASLTIIIPASVLVSTVMTYGRISADNEIITMRASGIHVVRILVPGILFGLIGSLALLVINDRLVPQAERHIKSMGSTVDYSEFLDTILNRGVKELDMNDWLLTWDACTRVSDSEGEEVLNNPVSRWVFSEIRAKRYDEEGNLKTEVIAESATVTWEAIERKLIFSLYMGKFVFGQEGSFEKLNLPPFEFKPKRQSKVRLSMRGLDALEAMKGRDLKAYPDFKSDTELHKRVADSFSPLVFVFLSLPIALLFRQQNRIVAFLISILVALFIYYPVSLLGETFAKNMIFPPILAIWPGNILLAVIGFFTILKVMRR